MANFTVYLTDNDGEETEFSVKAECYLETENEWTQGGWDIEIQDINPDLPLSQAQTRDIIEKIIEQLEAV